MKVYLKVPGHLSKAMFRVADALTRWLPEGVVLTKDPGEADFQVLHVVGDGIDALSNLCTQRYAVIQYCYGTTPDVEGLDRLWSGAQLVWSYLPIGAIVHVPFYHAPLGIDEAFKRQWNGAGRTVGVLTSGYVSGPEAEAIKETALAAAEVGLSVVHLGPENVQGMDTYPNNWFSTTGISDDDLCFLYQRSRWVSGLRHIEGFELPVIEGLASGVRPIVFDRPDMRQWYNGYAEFVADRSGPALVDDLVQLFKRGPYPVTELERKAVLERFDWEPIARGFWERAL